MIHAIVVGHIYDTFMSAYHNIINLTKSRGCVVYRSRCLPSARVCDIIVVKPSNLWEWVLCD